VKVAVIGAGIGGISAAYRLNKAGHEVVVYERSDFIGGRTKSVSRNGFTIDVGAGLLPGAYVDVKELLAEAGLNHLKEEVTGNCAFMRDGKAHLIGLGSMYTGMLRTRLVGWRTKLGMLKLMKLMGKHGAGLSYTNMGQSADLDTETVAEFCQRELPAEALDFLLGPFVRTMFLHPPEQASIAELLWSMKNLVGDPFSLNGGMNSLALALAEDLDVRLGAEVKTVVERESGVEISLVDDAGNEQTVQADCCVMATDAHALLGLYHHALTDRQKSYLKNLSYSVDLVVSFALSRAPAIDTTLVLVPESMDAELAALVIDNRKGSGRAPEGKGMVTSHFVSAWGERLHNSPDDDVVAEAKRSVEKIVPEVGTSFEFANIERWPRAATMSEVGTYRQLAGFMADIDPRSRVQLCGDYMSLSSVNVAVATAKVAVQNLLDRAPS